ncbi:MAG: TonB-dependent receptor, partial [Cytophagales bacterium]|nr:TonB-dependent receptor [Rhizobacter sp.]
RSVLTGDELRTVPGTGGDTMKALQSLPGVAVSDDSSSAPAIRGSRPNDNAYYIDFLPVGYLFHVGGLVSVVHSELVSRFELYSAAFGPEYRDAIGAVLDVTLRAPRSNRLSGTLNVSLLGADMLVEGPVNERQSFYFAVKRSYIDFLIKTVEDEDSGVIVSIPRYWDYQGKYIWNLNPGHQLSFHTTGASDHVDFKIPASATLATQQPVLAGDSTIDTSYGTQAVVWDADLGRNMSNRLALGHTLDRNTSLVGAALKATARSNTTFMREQFSLKPSANHDTAFGGSLQAVRADYDIDVQDARCTEFSPECDYTSADRKQVTGRISANITNLFAKNRWQATPDWAFTGGVHHTRDSYLRRHYTEPRVGVEWKWSPNLLFSAAWGRHNQFPAGEQVLSGLGNTGLWHLRATHSVLGVAQELEGGWSWRVEAYQKKFSDFVVADPSLNYINGASGRSRGLELLVKKEAAAKLSGWLSLSLSRARRQNDITGQEFPFDFDQPVIANLVAQYKLSDRWQFGAKWSYHTGAPDTPIVGTGTYPDGRVRPLYGELNSDRLPSYHRLDLRADWVLSPRYRFYGEVINAYARKNLSGYSYSADYSSRKDVAQLPFLVSFGVLAKF